jgi:hypothetical protein
MKYIELTLLMMLAFATVHSQTVNKENNRVLPPSPTAASLGKFGEVPVSLYTGTPNISVPIYQISQTNLSLPISLNYHAGSVRPTEIPGWAGLGWALNAGGVITRTVQDLPDDLNGSQPASGRGFYYDITASSGSTFNTMFDAFDGTPLVDELKDYMTNVEFRVYDSKPDEYNFNFGGYSGQFFFGQDGQIHLKSQQPFKITFTIANGIEGPTSFSSTGHFNKWIITTPDGIKYTFEKKEWSFAPIGTPGSVGNLAYVSSWYLTLIESPISGQISLEYTTQNGKVRVKESHSEKIGYVIPAGGGLGNAISASSNGRNLTFDEVIYLRKIVFTNGYLLFNTIQRNDPTYIPPDYEGASVQERKLENIELYSTINGNVKLMTWNFNYSETDRLKLISLVKKDNANTDGETYTFDYYAGAFSGNTGSANYQNPYDVIGTDHWGYYNGSSTITRLPTTPNPNNPGAYLGDAIKSVDPTAILFHVLKRINYPTGGYTEFMFEPNDYAVVVEPKDDWEPNYDSPPGESFVTYQDFYLMGPASGAYTCNSDPAAVTFTLPRETLVKKMIYEKYVQNDNVLPQCSQERYVYVLKQDVYLPAGTYNLNTLLNGAMSNDCGSIVPGEIIPGNSVMQCLEFRRYLIAVPRSYVMPDPPPPGTSLGGGIRIKEIKSFDGIKTETRSFTYRLTGSPNVSSGILNKYPQYFEPALEKFGFVGGYVLSSYPIKALPSGPPVGYSEVTENLADGGKIIHYFTNYSDFPDDKPLALQNHDYGPFINNDIKRGLPTLTRYLDNTGKLIRETIDEYEFGQSRFDGHMIDNKVILTFDSQAGDGQVNAVSKSKIPSIWLQKKRETDKLFDQQDGVLKLENITEYTYNAQNYQVSEQSRRNSKKEKIITAFKYPADFGGAAYDKLIADNRVADVVEQKVYRNTYDNEISASRINYILPSNVLSSVPGNKQSSIAGNVLETNLSYEVYDVDGRVLQLRGRDGIPISYLWGYSGVYPIAEIKNAQYTDVAYTSFETFAEGSWSYAGLPVLDNNAFTGSSIYGLAAGSITKSQLSSTGQYIVSYWSKSGPQNVNGTATTAGRTVGNWTYYQHVVTNPVNGVVSVSGQGLIDELRLHPANAFMTSLTYIPLIGVISECDANNRVIYYEYDSFNRVKLIRDIDKNILKTFIYKYQEPQ